MKSLKPKNRTRKNHIWENFVKNFAKKSLSGAILLVWQSGPSRRSRPGRSFHLGPGHRFVRRRRSGRRRQSAERGNRRDPQFDHRCPGPLLRPFLLSVGSYTVTVEKTGFQAQTRTGVSLVVGARIEVDVALGVTQLRQSVTVTEHPDFVAVTKEDVSGLVGETR